MRPGLILNAVMIVLGASLSIVGRAYSQSTPSGLIQEANMSTVGIAAGRSEGAPLRFADEISRILDDGKNLRVLPIVTRGPFENVNDLLFLRGVDMAIVYGDVLDYYKKHPPVPGFANRINYITHLFPSEVHIFARPEINSLADLAGKPVNFNTKGTAAAYSGPLVLERLGIKVDARFDPHPSAMREIAESDKYAAIVWISTKPLDAFIKSQWPPGFKFLPVPVNDALADYYLPAELEPADYPRLIPAGQTVQTISVPAVLAVYAWPGDSDRYRRVARFIDYLVERLPRLQQAPGFHPRWKDLNLAGAVPGWTRFPAMQAKLDQLAGGSRQVAANAPGSAVAAPAPQDLVLTPQSPRRQPQTEEDARELLFNAGFQAVGPLRRDERRQWHGIARRGNQRLHISIDRRGIIHGRRVSAR